MATESERRTTGGDCSRDRLGGNECLFEFDDLLRDQRSCQVR